MKELVRQGVVVSHRGEMKCSIDLHFQKSIHGNSGRNTQTAQLV